MGLGHGVHTLLAFIYLFIGLNPFGINQRFSCDYTDAEATG